LVLEQLARLNHEYEEKFGFKFVVFVNGRSRAIIVDILKARLENGREQELETGLRDMILIARDRLNKLAPKLYTIRKTCRL
jgi:2-oxo-4-hydroxy-4-carboxy-5-ureidoimidazoline decarboxylase